jgi:chitodextrinase
VSLSPQFRRHTGAVILVVVMIAVLAASASAEPVTSQRTTVTGKSIVGQLVERHGDNFSVGRPTKTTFAVVGDGGRTLQVAIGAAIGDRLVGKHVVVSFDAQGRTSVALAPPQRRLSAIRASMAATGTKRVAVVLVNFSNDSSQPYTPAYAAGVAFTNSDSVAAYYSDSSWGELSLAGDVYGWYTIPDTDSTCSTDTWANSANKAATAAGVNLSAYTNVVYAFPLASSCPWNGWADLPGTRSWLNGPGGMTLQGMAHELGHNFGLNHASSLVCTENGVKVALSANSSNCTIGDYGDPFSVMGAAKHYGHTNFARGTLGLLSPENTQTVTTSGDYILAPIESYNPTSTQVLRIPRTSGTYFTLEFRQPASIFDTFSSTDAAVTGIIVRVAPDYGTARSQLVDTTPGSMMSFFDAPLTVGKTLVDPVTGISITTVSVSPLGAMARITFGGANPVSPADTSPPTQPSNLSATPLDATHISLSWTASSDNVAVAGYRIYRGSTLVSSVSTPGFADTGLVAGTSYTYQVFAFDAAGNTSTVATATGTTTTPSTTASDGSPPTPPTNLTASLGKGKKVVLSWGSSTDNTGVAGYYVYRNGSLDGTTSATTYTDTLPARASTATYFVIAYDAAGNLSSPSNSASP